MQFIDLKKQQDKIRESLDARIKNVLDNGQYILGKEVNLFEENLSQFDLICQFQNLQWLFLQPHLKVGYYLDMILSYLLSMGILIPYL